MKCSCPYYEKGNNCKHLYALLIETKLKDNYDKLIILKNKKLNKLKKQFKLYKEHLINNINKYTEYNQKIINIFIDYYEKELIPKYEKLDDNEMSQNEFLEMIEEMQYKINTMKDLYYEIKSKENNSNEENKSNILLFGILSGIAKGLNSPSQQQLNENSIRKMAMEELEKGNSEPYIIEYNELEDDMFQDYE